MIQVTFKYIDIVIDNLFDFIGVKEEIQKAHFLKLVRGMEIQKCVQEIANYMLLPVIVNLVSVPSTYDIRHTGSSSFASDKLVVTDSSGRANESISAQVFIPNNLPFFGSSSFKDYPIEVRISDNLTNYPETFIAIMAHEFSHLVLHSLLHKEKDNEVYTDITSMLLGFNSIVRDGRTIIEENYDHTNQTTFGYLSDKIFRYANSRISGLLIKNKSRKDKIVKKVSFLEKQFPVLKQNLEKVRTCKSLIDLNRKKRISAKDSQKIVALHQFSYFTEMEYYFKTVKEDIKRYQYYRHIQHYHKDWDVGLDESLSRSAYSMKNYSRQLKRDLKTLKRNIPWIVRLKSHYKNRKTEV